MNIKEAKEQIKNTVQVYLSKDELGYYEIPIEKQRPVFLMGPPGIGKTAIMEQIAEEVDIALVSYSMTHHTRQSAIGLPFIDKKIYGGREYSVSEYTMSEIISSVYDVMETSGKKEGILFLDEINCVSETLSPAILQFLQMKIFGKHRVPDGWVIVTAGNPPEYNKSVHDFDFVTWDRLKRIDVEPDFEIWKEYAYKKEIHPAVITYLDSKRNDFYDIETTVNGMKIATARGWEDLSVMIRISEKLGIKIDENAIHQYIQNDRIAKDFSVYYDLYLKYKDDYKVELILEGKVTEDILSRANQSSFDERVLLIGLLLDRLTGEIKDVLDTNTINKKLLVTLKELRIILSKDLNKGIKFLVKKSSEINTKITKGENSNNLSKSNKYTLLKEQQRLQYYTSLIKSNNTGKEAFETIRSEFNKTILSTKDTVKELQSKIGNMLEFAEKGFKSDIENTIIVTELTANPFTATFISQFGCEAYFKYNKNLLFYERNIQLLNELSEIE